MNLWDFKRVLVSSCARVLLASVMMSSSMAMMNNDDDDDVDDKGPNAVVRTPPKAPAATSSSAVEAKTQNQHPSNPQIRRNIWVEVLKRFEDSEYNDLDNFCNLGPTAMPSNKGRIAEIMLFIESLRGVSFPLKRSVQELTDAHDKMRRDYGIGNSYEECKRYAWTLPFDPNPVDMAFLVPALQQASMTREQFEKFNVEVNGALSLLCTEIFPGRINLGSGQFTPIWNLRNGPPEIQLLMMESVLSLISSLIEPDAPYFSEIYEELWKAAKKEAGDSNIGSPYYKLARTDYYGVHRTELLSFLYPYACAYISAAFAKAKMTPDEIRAFSESILFSSNHKLRFREGGFKAAWVIGLLIDARMNRAEMDVFWGSLLPSWGRDSLQERHQTNEHFQVVAKEAERWRDQKRECKVSGAPLEAIDPALHQRLRPFLENPGERFPWVWRLMSPWNLRVLKQNIFMRKALIEITDPERCLVIASFASYMPLPKESDSFFVGAKSLANILGVREASYTASFLPVAAEYSDSINGSKMSSVSRAHTLSTMVSEKLTPDQVKEFAKAIQCARPLFTGGKEEGVGEAEKPEFAWREYSRRIVTVGLLEGGYRTPDQVRNLISLWDQVKSKRINSNMTAEEVAFDIANFATGAASLKVSAK